MSTRNKKRKVNKKGRNEYQRYVMLFHWMLASPAYRLLSPAARALLIEIMGIYNGGNNGAIFVSQRTAADLLGIKTHQTAGKYLTELEERGFLRVRIAGSFSVKQRHATVYSLTMHPLGDKPATKDFMSLKLTDAEKLRVQKANPLGVKKLPVGWKDLPDEFVAH